MNYSNEAIKAIQKQLIEVIQQHIEPLLPEGAKTTLSVSFEDDSQEGGEQVAKNILLSNGNLKLSCVSIIRAIGKQSMDDDFAGVLIAEMMESMIGMDDESEDKPEGETDCDNCPEREECEAQDKEAGNIH